MDLAVRHHDGELGGDEPAVGDLALPDRLLARQVLDLPVQPRELLEVADQSLVLIAWVCV
jgi:hypothetical protein